MKYLRMLLIIATIVCCLSTSKTFAQKNKNSVLQSVASKSKPFLFNGKSIPQREVPKSYKPIENNNLNDLWSINYTTPTARLIVYEYIDCDVPWNRRCEGEYTITAWPDWQVCKALYDVKQQGGHDAWFSQDPKDWYTYDPESPDRFRSIRFQIHAFGSGNPFNQVGSRMWVTDVGILMIPAQATNFERYATGCSMPSHD